MQVTLLLRNLPFEVERTICSRTNSLLGRRPSSAPFLSGDTFRAMADFVFDETGDFEPARVLPGSIVFVGVHRLREFAARVLPALKAPIVLLTHQGDLNIDESFSDIADHPRISHWFAQNCLFEHPKVSPLPIGLEDRWRHNNGEVSDFRRIAREAGPKIPRIAYAFTLGTNLEKRIECYRALKYCRASKELPQPLNSSLYRNMVKDYMLIASPPGNGLDCHRTWEALYMQCVPIVEDNYMNRSFVDSGLPLILAGAWDEVRDWSEEDVSAAYSRAIGGGERSLLQAGYWRKVFDEKRRQRG
jgi:hypothetical protein